MAVKGSEWVLPVDAAIEAIGYRPRRDSPNWYPSVAVDAGGLDTGVLAAAVPDGGMLDGAALDGAALEGAALEGIGGGVAPGTRPCRCAAWSARNDASRPASSG